VLSVAVAGAATMTLMACHGGPSTIDDCMDLDDDGWFPACYDEPCDTNEDPYCDCNDGDPGIHPGAADPLGDGLDQDCSGEDGPDKCEGGCPDASTIPDAPPLPDAADPAPDATQ
jgi:hypothetical protein